MGSDTTSLCLKINRWSLFPLETFKTFFLSPTFFCQVTFLYLNCKQSHPRSSYSFTLSGIYLLRSFHSWSTCIILSDPCLPDSLPCTRHVKLYRFHLCLQVAHPYLSCRFKVCRLSSKSPV